jgi:diguanylate cyclase (GGDEF)-like protein
VRQSIRLTDQLRRSHIDGLTGLVNRQGVLDLDLRGHRGCSLVLMDLDGFKEVNDSLGHHAGDRLLQMVAGRLQDRVRAGDVLARLGGDEFAVILWGTDVEGAVSAAESMVHHLELPLELDGVPLLVTACAGVVSADSPRPDVGTLLKHADTALYSAKREGPGLVHAYGGDIGELSQERLRIRAEARASLARGGDDFLVHYQPMVGIGGQPPLCVEALVRWQHNGRLMMPAEFLPEVLRGGDMPALTRHMLRASLAQLAAAGLDVAVSVNVPPELITPWLLDESEAALAAAGLPPDRLIVEITEEAIMKDPDGVADVLRRLRERSIRVLLDDFGTGWSGLSSLRDLIVDGIKIDHSFVSRLTTEETAASIVRGISHVASELGVLVIYEGAESRDTTDALREYPAGYVQGFSAARPMPIGDLARWFALNPSPLPDANVTPA